MATVAFMSETRVSTEGGSSLLQVVTLKCVWPLCLMWASRVRRIPDRLCCGWLPPRLGVNLLQCLGRVVTNDRRLVLEGLDQPNGSDE